MWTNNDRHWLKQILSVPTTSTLPIEIQHTCRQFTVTLFAPAAIQHVKWSMLIVLLTGEVQEVQCKNTSAISLAPTIRTTWTKKSISTCFEVLYSSNENSSQWGLCIILRNRDTVPGKTCHCWIHVSMLWAAQTLFTSIVLEVEAEIQVLSCNMSVFTVWVFYTWEGQSEKVQSNNNYILHTALSHSSIAYRSTRLSGGRGLTACWTNVVVFLLVVIMWVASWLQRVKTYLKDLIFKFTIRIFWYFHWGGPLSIQCESCCQWAVSF